MRTAVAGGIEASGPTPVGAELLLERELELDTLSRALAGARSGTGALVLIEGPAGIGKSRLLGAACEEAQREGMQVLRARGLELEREVPFGVAVELFATRLASADSRERESLLSGQAGLTASLFDSTRTGSVEAQALVRGLFWLTVNLASSSAGGAPTTRSRGLAIVLDDAHWADRPSMAFAAHLAMRLADLPVTLIVALRTGEATAADDIVRWVREVSECVRLAPAALSDPAVGRLVANELPGADPEFVTACARVSGGNPFMTRELALALRAEGIPPTVESVSRVEQLVPATVLHSLLTRLGRLGEPALRIAAAVAVLGDHARLRHAAALAELGMPEAEAAADALAKARILAAGEPLGFAHPLIATAVYSDLPAFARARAHRTAAALLASDGRPAHELAAHLLLTTPEGDPWVLATLREAARRDMEQGDPQAAARLLTRALAEPPPADQRADVLLDLADAQAMSGNIAAEDHALQAVRLLNGSPGHARALRVLSRVRLATGAHEEAAEALQTALDELGTTDPAAQQILAEFLTVNRFRVPLQPQAQARLAPIVEAARRGSPPSDTGLMAHVALSLAFAGESVETVRGLAGRATAEDPLVDFGSYGMPMGMLVQALCCVDELETAEQIAVAGLASARRRGSFIAAALGSFHVAIPRYHRGALADALADLYQAQAPRREGWGGGTDWPLALQAQAELERGDLRAARESLATCSAAPESMERAMVTFAHARLALANRDPGAALADALAAGRHLSEGFGIDHPPGLALGEPHSAAPTRSLQLSAGLLNWPLRGSPTRRSHRTFSSRPRLCKRTSLTPIASSTSAPGDSFSRRSGDGLRCWSAALQRARLSGRAAWTDLRWVMRVARRSSGASRARPRG